MSKENVTAEAVRWVARLSLGGTSEVEVAQLKEWIASDPTHREEFERARRLYAGLAECERPDREARVSRRRRLGMRSAITSALLAAAACAGLAFIVPRYANHDFASPTGQVTQATLPDGTSIWLDSDSAADFRVHKGRRVVSLVRGRIHVAVAPRTGEPFVVETPRAVIRDIGTAFTVDESEETLRVDVHEGAVQVSFAGKTSMLQAGRSARFAPGESVVSVHLDERVESAWRHGRIILDHTSLTETLQVVERYRRGSVVLLDASLADLPMSGSLSIQDIEGSLDALAAGSGLDLWRLPFILIVTRAHPAPAAGG